ncbi:MAG: hypothetical protein FJX72_12705 [Armatimonadetes bacterium]|nr:hypothetical protein [Armatimonadota bacterium]
MGIQKRLIRAAVMLTIVAAVCPGHAPAADSPPEKPPMLAYAAIDRVDGSLTLQVVSLNLVFVVRPGEPDVQRRVLTCDAREIVVRKGEFSIEDAQGRRRQVAKLAEPALAVVLLGPNATVPQSLRRCLAEIAVVRCLGTPPAAGTPGNAKPLEPADLPPSLSAPPSHLPPKKPVVTEVQP